MDGFLQNEAMELGNVCLRVRKGIRFDLHEYGGKPSYVVKNSMSSEYFQVGIAEYAFISLLDGHTSLQQAVQETALKLGEDAFTIRDAIGACHWLIENSLAEPVNPGHLASQTNVHGLIEQTDKIARTKTVSQLNPLFVKLPLADPEPLIAALAPALGWIGSKTFLLIWSCVIAVALSCFCFSTNDVAIAAKGIFAPNAWLWLIATFAGMKIVHELAHGLICHRFQGRVKETGLVFILCMPIPYVDVTSCWGFPSKWQRIAVSAAGMYIELFLAAVATIAWSFAYDPLIKFHLFNVMLTGTLSTLVFNANFLMRFDGYYILADLLEIPNLYQSGQQDLNYLGKRYLLGMEVLPARHDAVRGKVIRAYGIAALCWRIFICVSLSILATALFYGFGVALAILGIALWVGMPIQQFTKFLNKSARQLNARRISTVTIPIGACLIAAFFLVPWPFRVSAPAVVEYKDPAIIRIESSGFVQSVNVANGQFVKSGDLLVELENRELDAELQGLQMEYQRSTVSSRRFHTDRQVAAYQAEVATKLAIEEKIQAITRKRDDLVVRAPVDGQVVAVNLSSIVGRHLTIGSELLQIVDEREKEIVASISQDDFESFDSTRDKTAVFLPCHSIRKIKGELDLVEPTASSDADIRLTTIANGDLAVRPASKSSTADQESMELVHPRFRGVVAVHSEDCDAINAGQTGHVRLNRYSDSIGMHLVKRTRSWLLESFDLAKHSIQ